MASRLTLSRAQPATPIAWRKVSKPAISPSTTSWPRLPRRRSAASRKAATAARAAPRDLSATPSPRTCPTLSCRDLLRLCCEAPEAVVLKDPEGPVRADEIQPCPCRHGMRCVGDHRSAVVGERVELGRDINVTDRVADLLLEDRLRSPCHPGLDQVLHQKERCLAVMDTREHGLSVPHLLAIDHLGQR